MLGACAIALIAAAAIYVHFDRIVLYAIAKTHGLDISYVNGFRIIDRTSGIGLQAKDADIKTRWSPLSMGDVELDFVLHGVQFIKNIVPAEESYDTLTGLVNSPFYGRWRYREMSGKIDMSGKGINIKEFKAASDEIRFSLTGNFYRDNNVELASVIYFSKDVVNKVPEELSNVVLQGEPDSWQSLSVNLKGNYKTPSIQVASKLFRLNIKTISGAE